MSIANTFATHLRSLTSLLFTLVTTLYNKVPNSTFCPQSRFEIEALKVDLKPRIYVYAEFTTCSKSSRRQWVLFTGPILLTAKVK